MLDTTANVFAKSELLLSVGLDVPQVSRLCLRLREEGIELPEGIYDKTILEKALLRLFGKEAEA